MRWTHSSFMYHLCKSNNTIGSKPQCFSTIASKDDHYTTLGIGRNATKAEIKAAYYGKCKILHPDVIYGAGSSIKEDSASQRYQDDSSITHKFRLVAEAYECLSDSEARKIYDASLLEARHNNNKRTFWYEEDNPYQTSVRNVRNRYNSSYYEELRNRRTPPGTDANATYPNFDRNTFEETARLAKNRVTQQSYPSMWWLTRNESRLGSAQKTQDFTNPTPSQNEYSFYYKGPEEAYNHRDYFEDLHRTRQNRSLDFAEDFSNYKTYDNRDAHTHRHRTRLKLVVKYTLLTLVYGLFTSIMTIAIFKEEIKEINATKEKSKPDKE